MATGLTSTGITFPDSTTQTTAAAGSTSASDLTSGTLPDARFPSALPAIDGSALTGLAVAPTMRFADKAAGSSNEFYFKFTSNATIAGMGGATWPLGLTEAADSYAGNFSFTNSATESANNSTSFNITNNTGSSIDLTTYNIEFSITHVDGSIPSGQVSIQIGSTSPNNTVGGMNWGTTLTGQNTVIFTDTSLSTTWADGGKITMSSWDCCGNTGNFQLDHIALYTNATGSSASIDVGAITDLQTAINADHNVIGHHLSGDTSLSASYRWFLL
tara:strand:- start:187 stop:1005 length:819 start_codon:yes stop_codon:yes gene_type:complete